MRSISIRDDIEQVILQYARSIPEVFMAYDIESIEVWERSSLVWDLIFVESEETELVIGEITLNSDFEAFFDIFEEEVLELTEELG